MTKLNAAATICRVIGEILFLIFVGLKLTGVIGWSWWWVWAPIWGVTGIAVIGIITILAIRGTDRLKTFSSAFAKG